MLINFILLLSAQGCCGICNNLLNFDYDKFYREKSKMIKTNDGVRCLTYEKYLFNRYIQNIFLIPIIEDSCPLYDIYYDSIIAFIKTKEILNDIYQKNINNKYAKKLFKDRKNNYELFFKLVQGKLKIPPFLFFMFNSFIGVIAFTVTFTIMKKINK